MTNNNRTDQSNATSLAPSARLKSRLGFYSHVFLFALIALSALAFVAWVTDFITSPGEWTIYTASCVGGEWKHAECTGSLAASKLYRFRALKAHREVLFWTVRERGNSGRYTGCKVANGRNWICPPNADAARTITHEMQRGDPVPDPSLKMIEYHQVKKWKWELLRLGIGSGSSAMN